MSTVQCATHIIGASLSEPHLVLLVDGMCVHTYHMSSAHTKAMYMYCTLYKCACLGQPKHVHKPPPLVFFPYSSV